MSKGIILILKWAKKAVAKFNEGKLGGVYYKASPSGFRKYLRFGRVSLIPYILGYDIKINLLLKLTKAKEWYPEGLLKPELPVEYPNNPFEINEPDKKGRWLQELYIGHPSKPVVFSCNLQLQNIQETDNYLRPKIERTASILLVEDIRFLSLHTVLAWSIGIILGVAVFIVAILNLVVGV